MSSFSSAALLQLARGSHLALLAWVILWHSWLSPDPEISQSFLLLLWVTPLMLPLPGIFKGKPYTFAWASFVLLLYVLHSVTLLVVSSEERWLAAVELVLVSVAFVSGIYYARQRGRELGLGLKKKRKD